MRIPRIKLTQALLIFSTLSAALSQQFPPDRPPLPGPLSRNAVPLPPNLAEFVTDRQAAVVLGKAFFWDQQAGSDGLACASCHFQAGADNRIKNQLNPGLRNTNAAAQNVWNLVASKKSNRVGPPPGGGPNYTLTKNDFPFHQLSDPADRNSRVVFDSDDVVSSQGVFRGQFSHIDLSSPAKKAEACSFALSPTFSVGGINVRQVEPRNSPTVVNAIFNFRNFWDGRANNVFNGRNPFGMRDPSAGVDPLNSVLVSDAYGNLKPLQVILPNASLASQAVGPPGSDLEMSCNGRVFEEIGRKLLRLSPLATQKVDRTDSVLGPYAKPGNGLTIGYEALIQKAFAPRFWNSGAITADGYRQIEKNFSLFWGLAIMLYEATLVSDDTPFDRYVRGDITAMTTQQVNGFLQVYAGKGGCIFCHKGPEFTGGASALHQLKSEGGLVEHMVMGDGTTALYDSGFYNIGVRPTGEDIGAGGTDPWGNPLSWTRQAKMADLQQPTVINVGPDGITVNSCTFLAGPCVPVAPSTRDAVDGSFKVPTLRNVELTGPFFHNGGYATLEQVIDFYNRGGDAAGSDAVNATGFGPNLTNRAPSIFSLRLTSNDKANLLAFLKALTDERVRWEKAPFDHPSLSLPNGHMFSETNVIRNGNTPYAMDSLYTLPAVGAAGREALKLPSLQPFEAGLR